MLKKGKVEYLLNKINETRPDLYSRLNKKFEEKIPTDNLNDGENKCDFFVLITGWLYQIGLLQDFETHCMQGSRSATYYSRRPEEFLLVVNNFLQERLEAKSNDIWYRY